MSRIPTAIGPGLLMAIYHPPIHALHNGHQPMNVLAGEWWPVDSRSRLG